MGFKTRVFRRLGIAEISPEVPSTKSEFYPRELSCQIKNIGFLYERFLGRKKDGFFVEVGGFDGVFASNSWGLAKAGWRGFLVEPIPEFAEQCRRNHRDHPGVKVLEVAIGPPGRQTISLAKGSTLTTANPDAVEEYRGVSWSKHITFEKPEPYPACTLDALLESEGLPKEFDCLIIDVEGFETEVFAGFTIEDWRPRMVIVELADTHPDLSSTAKKDSELMSQLLGEGYVPVYKDEINTVFVEQETYKSGFSV